jgi:hypothetical protein
MGVTELPSQCLRKNDVGMMICAGLEHKALRIFELCRIQASTGTKSTLKEALTAWKTEISKPQNLKTFVQDRATNKNVIIKLNDFRINKCIATKLVQS